MGYKHYWYRPKIISPEKYAVLYNDMLKVLDSLPAVYPGAYYRGTPILLKGWDGELPFEPDPTDFGFSGDADTGMSHETFRFDREIHETRWAVSKVTGGKPLFRESCETGRKPYDLAVCACLLVAKHHLPEMVIESDGEMDKQSWPHAFDLVENVLGIQLSRNSQVA